MSHHTTFTQAEIDNLVIPPDCIHLIEDYIQESYLAEWKTRLASVNDHFNRMFFIMDGAITTIVNPDGGMDRITRHLVYLGKSRVRRFDKLSALSYPLPENYHCTKLYPELTMIEFDVPEPHLPTLKLPPLFLS